MMGSFPLEITEVEGGEVVTNRYGELWIVDGEIVRSGDFLGDASEYPERPS